MPPIVNPPPLALRAAALAFALQVSACSAPEPRTPQQQATDTALATRVEAALRADRYVDATHVRVEANHGLVTLSGQVGDEWDLHRILKICSQVPGVRGVADRLEFFDFGRAGF